jgi:hypothetical protein
MYPCTHAHRYRFGPRSGLCSQNVEIRSQSEVPALQWWWVGAWVGAAVGAVDGAREGAAVGNGVGWSDGS